MALNHQNYTLSSTTTTLITVDSGNLALPAIDMSIQNVSSTAFVYVGNSSVSTTNYGLRIAPGAVLSIDQVMWKDEIYAISDTNGSAIAVIRLDR
jgi:hypothetical protein